MADEAGAEAGLGSGTAAHFPAAKLGCGFEPRFIRLRGRKKRPIFLNAKTASEFLIDAIAMLAVALQFQALEIKTFQGRQRFPDVRIYAAWNEMVARNFHSALDEFLNGRLLPFVPSAGQLVGNVNFLNRLCGQNAQRGGV